MSQPIPLSRILRHPIADAESRESSALLVGSFAFVAGLVPALFLFWGSELPISGRGSLGDYAAIGAAIVSLVAVVYGCMLRRASTGRALPAGSWRRLRWYDIAALALAHAIIALLGWIGLASVFSASFEGAVVYATAAAVLAGVVMAVSAYAAFLSAVGLTPIRLSVVLALFLVVGTLASMLSAGDPLWWQKNLSTLGISDDVSARTFNITLVIAGVIVTTIAHYATAWLPASTRAETRGRNLVRLALILIGILLACVGIFPVDEHLELHNLSATGMAIIYVVLVLSLRALVPSMPRVFLLLGYVFVAVIVVLAAFFISGYYNLTAVELVAFTLIFAWLIVFLRNMGSVTPAAVAGGLGATKSQAAPSSGAAEPRTVEASS